MRIHISRAGNVTEEVKKAASALSKVISRVIAILRQHRAHIFQALIRNRCKAESQNIATVRGKVNITVN